MKSFAAIDKKMGRGSRVLIAADNDPGGRAPADQIEAIARESGGTQTLKPIRCAVLTVFRGKTKKFVSCLHMGALQPLVV